MAGLEEQLQLNGKDEGDAHKSFYGPLTEQMPQLRVQGQTPVSLAYAIHRRLHAPVEVLPAWRNNYFFTADGIEYNGRGDVKIVLDQAPTYGDILQGALDRNILSEYSRRPFIMAARKLFFKK